MTCNDCKHCTGCKGFLYGTCKIQRALVSLTIEGAEKKCSTFKRRNIFTEKENKNETERLE